MRQILSASDTSCDHMLAFKDNTIINGSEPGVLLNL